MDTDTTQIAADKNTLCCPSAFICGEKYVLG